MAGVTDLTFRTLCKELGADVMVTEFVSAEGIVRADARTRKYTAFTDAQRPVGVQLFGADPARLGEAARKVIDWKEPDFIDINFGCPVNKVVSKNGGSSLLRDCPILAAVAEGIVKAVAGQVPVTAKIRIGWDSQSINAPEVCRLLTGCGISRIAIHGRTRAQGYSGQACWETIAECAASCPLPIIGNGDLACAADIAHRAATTQVAGFMIGRAAMAHPWIFQEAKHFLATGTHLAPPSPQQRWQLARRHCAMAIESGRYGAEQTTLSAMRARLMAYSKRLPGGKSIRPQLSTVSSLAELEDIAAAHLASIEAIGTQLPCLN